MDSVFGNAEVTAPVEVATETTSAKKEKVNAMKQALKATIASTPDFAERLRRLSGSIKVVNTLGYGKAGNIVVDKKATKEGDGNRVIKPTSAICGYKLQNIGTEVIPYKTEVFKQDETGKYVGEVVDKQWAPGETICLTRMYTTMLASDPEISFTFANGKIVSSSRKNCKSLKEELSSYYFTFDKDETGYKPEVNDDEVKLSVDDADGKVKPEYVETFGYLNNPKEGRKAGQKSAKFTTQDLAANYIHTLLKEQDM